MLFFRLYGLCRKLRMHLPHKDIHQSVKQQRTQKVVGRRGLQRFGRVQFEQTCVSDYFTMSVLQQLNGWEGEWVKQKKCSTVHSPGCVSIIVLIQPCDLISDNCRLVLSEFLKYPIANGRPLPSNAVTLLCLSMPALMSRSHGTLHSNNIPYCKL